MLVPVSYFQLSVLRCSSVTTITTRGLNPWYMEGKNVLLLCINLSAIMTSFSHINEHMINNDDITYPCWKKQRELRCLAGINWYNVEGNTVSVGPYYSFYLRVTVLLLCLKPHHYYSVIATYNASLNAITSFRTYGWISVVALYRAADGLRCCSNPKVYLDARLADPVKIRTTNSLWAPH